MLIALAQTLIPTVPAIAGWLGGEKAEQAAEGVLDVARAVTGNNDPAQAAEACRADPAMALAFRSRMMDHAETMNRLYLEDRQDARARDVALRHVGAANRRADIMLLMAFLAVIAIAAILAFGKLSGDSMLAGFLTTIGGMFARNIGSAFDFEFGSSRSSQEKTALLGDAARPPRPAP